MPAMDSVLKTAIGNWVGRFDQREEVADLLIIEVDWGTRTPPLMVKSTTIMFQGQQWPITFTGSELVMRQALCHSTHGRAIIMMPGSREQPIPQDILARAHKGTVYTLGVRYLLYAKTDRDWPDEVNYPEWQPTIDQRFDDLVRSAGGKALQFAISRNELENILVGVAFGLTKVEDRTGSQLLADLAAFQSKNSTQSTELELSIFEGQLRQHEIIHAEILVWTAEEIGRAEQLVLTGVKMAVEKTAGYEPPWENLSGLRAILLKRGMTLSEAYDVVISLATETLPYLHHRRQLRIVRTAEKELIGVLPDEAYNDWFPVMLDRESRHVAEQLGKRDLQAVTKVQRLQNHLFASQQGDRLETLSEMAGLISRWEIQSSIVKSLNDVEEWAKWYVHEGSYLDLSALMLMYYRQHGMGLAEPIIELLQSYWKWRNQLNKAFAEVYLANYESALHDRDAGVFGTHRIIEWVIRPLRKEDKRVLLLVVDGMSYPDFRVLMTHWARETSPVYAEERNIALSLLPSVTSVSRWALFNNQLRLDPLDGEEAYDEKARTSEKDGLQKALPKDAVNLYNKGNLNGGQDLRDDLQFLKYDVIAAILNAIDDGLSSTTTNVRLYEPSEVGALATTVQTALKTGWTVVITADHGHTWFRNKTLRRGATPENGSARFLPVDAKTTVPHDGIVTQDPHILKIQSGKKVAFLTATGTYFGHHPRRGFHGGLSLEEIVIPCAFLSYKAKTETGEDVAVKIVEDSGIDSGKVEIGAVILKFRDRQPIELVLPFSLSTRETRILQVIAWQGEASESDLKKAVGTRRVAGPIAALRDKLAAAGPQFDLIEQVGAGAGGSMYRFRTELLSESE